MATPTPPVHKVVRSHGTTHGARASCEKQKRGGDNQPEDDKDPKVAKAASHHTCMRCQGPMEDGKAAHDLVCSWTVQILPGDELKYGLSGSTNLSTSLGRDDDGTLVQSLTWPLIPETYKRLELLFDNIWPTWKQDTDTKFEARAAHRF
jgi:hypothetical protein